MRKWSFVAGSGGLAAIAVFLGSQVLRQGTPSSPRDLVTETPSLVVREVTHDFGIIDPGQPCRHLFIVRNEGTAPLKIAKAGTSCKCTVSVLPEGDIPPGKGGPVEIESKTDQSHGKFRHTAGFLTNDPLRPRFELTIEGDIRSYLAASPADVHLTDLEPGKPVEGKAVVYSQVWKDFLLKDVKSSIDGLTWDFQPAPAERLQEQDARSGYVATFHVPASAASKSFSGWVEAVAEPRGQPLNAKTIRLALSGNVPPLRSVFGEHVDHEGVVSIGAVKQGEGATVRLLLKVRGEHREIRVQEIEKSPGFLNVSVEAQTPELAKKGLYTIVLEVPRDAPQCNYMIPDNMGEIRIVTDHPQMPEIVRLKVAFLVATT